MTRTFSNMLVTLVTMQLFMSVVTWNKPAAAAEPFLGQIEYYGFNFAPRGWAKCDGQLLPINQNQSLYSLLGTTFGGDGRTSFALPDMRGRMPIHDGGSAGTNLTRRVLGTKGGQETVVLAGNNIPSHTHTLRGTTNAGNQVLPESNALADDNPDQTYRNEAPNTTMHAGSIGAVSQAHENMPPFLVVNCNIALRGLFPSRN